MQKFAQQLEICSSSTNRHIIEGEFYDCVASKKYVHVLLVTRFDAFISVETKCQNIQTTRAWFCMLEELKEQQSTGS